MGCKDGERDEGRRSDSTQRYPSDYERMSVARQTNKQAGTRVRHRRHLCVFQLDRHHDRDEKSRVCGCARGKINKKGQWTRMPKQGLNMITAVTGETTAPTF